MRSRGKTLLERVENVWSTGGIIGAGMTVAGPVRTVIGFAWRR